MRRVLLIAEQANPEWVSVPLIGWSLAKAIFDRIPSLIVTHVRNYAAFVRAGMSEGRDFVAIDNEFVARRLHKVSQLIRGGDGKGWTAVTAMESLAYYAFERELWRQFGPGVEAGQFFAVHRITPLSPTAPSIIAKRCARAGVPFLLGPLNGGLPWPNGFSKRRHLEKEWLSYFRALHRLLPGQASCREHASVIFVASRATERQFAKKHQAKLKFMPENGIWANAISAVTRKEYVPPLRAVFVGRLVAYKCPDLLFQAARPLIEAGKLHLTYVGAGPLEQQLIREVRDAGCESGVEFRGWLNHGAVLDVLSQSDFLVLPSIREFGGGVVIESMARGVPCVVADYGGPAELVDSDTGWTVSFNDESSLLLNLREKLKEIVENPAELARRARNCIDKVKNQYTWESKAQKIIEIYRFLSLARLSPRPE